VAVADHKVVGKVKQESPFCPNIAATPEGDQVWLTLKDVGKTMAFSARPPFHVLKVLDTGPITNHVNIVRNAHGRFAYVTVGGLNAVLAFRTDTFEQVARIPVGELPHGIWPSGDGTRIYVGIENGDTVTAIDTLENKVVATIPIGQAAQAVVYVPNAVTGLEPRKPYVLALSPTADAGGPLEPLAGFVTNPADAAIVNAVGPIRQVVQGTGGSPRRYLVILGGTPAVTGAPVQVQLQ